MLKIAHKNEQLINVLSSVITNKFLFLREALQLPIFAPPRVLILSSNSIPSCLIQLSHLSAHIFRFTYI